MSNCVTTPTNNGGRARTSADRQRRSEPRQPKTAPASKLLRDEEVLTQCLAATLPPTQLALVDDMAAWLRPVGVRRGTRVPDRSAHPPSWLTVLG